MRVEIFSGNFQMTWISRLKVWSKIIYLVMTFRNSRRHRSRKWIPILFWLMIWFCHPLCTMLFTRSHLSETDTVQSFVHGQMQWFPTWLMTIIVLMTFIVANHSLYIFITICVGAAEKSIMRTAMSVIERETCGKSERRAFAC